MTLKTLQWENFSDLVSIRTSLKSGEILVGTSDTVFGLLAVSSLESYKKLKMIKKRDKKPFLLLIASPEVIQELAVITNPVINSLMAECWPGPLTLILKAKPGVPEYLTGGKETIAFRIPRHKGLQTLLKDFPILFSTSANLSGQPVPMKLNEVDQSILDACSFAVLDEQKEESEPSTILDCSGDSITLIRAGAFPLEKIEKIIGYSLNKN